VTGALPRGFLDGLGRLRWTGCCIAAGGSTCSLGAMMLLTQSRRGVPNKRSRWDRAQAACSSNNCNFCRCHATDWRVCETRRCCGQRHVCFGVLFRVQSVVHSAERTMSSVTASQVRRVQYSFRPVSSLHVMVHVWLPCPSGPEYHVPLFPDWGVMSSSLPGDPQSGAACT